MQEAALEPGTAVFADQFDNAANFRAHLRTGEEIWQQTGGILDAFVSGAGTGGTIAGVSHQLKTRDPSIKVTLSSRLVVMVMTLVGHKQTCCCMGSLAGYQHFATADLVLVNVIPSFLSMAASCRCAGEMLTLPMWPV